MSVEKLLTNLTADKSSWSASEIAELFARGSMHDLGQAALEAKDRLFGQKVFWIKNCHINYTNICQGSCRFCFYRRKENDHDAFCLDPDEILSQASAAVADGACEIHLVGGLNGSLDLDYYSDLIRRLRSNFSGLYIKAFTAVEIDFVSRRDGVSVEAVLDRLRDAGLDCLAGGGAEIFSDRVRSELCPQKISGPRWLEIHRIAHRLGLRSNATMLFGHIETASERAEHLLDLRALQEKTGGFLSFLPLPVVNFEGRSISGIDALKTVAISRLVLDNISHIKVFWPIWTPKLAQLALSYGADDFDGTIGAYRIVNSDDTGSDDAVDPSRVQRWIEHAGFEPAERTGDYRCRT